MNYQKHYDKPRSKKFQDLTGQRFHRLIVVGFAGMLGKVARAHWLCQCDCGGKTIAAAGHLKKGNVKSCGCLLLGPKIDLTGMRFARWTVIRHAQKRYWFCRCDCGTEKEVYASSLTDGLSQSCGCHRRENSAKLARKLQERMRLEGRGSRTTHGGSYTPEHRAWRHMKERCFCPNDKRYADYGGRGITVCERWIHSFENFLADVGFRSSAEHSLDRINVNRGYEPDNVRWATKQVQATNTRRKRIENFTKEEKLRELARCGVSAELLKKLKEQLGDNGGPIS